MTTATMQRRRRTRAEVVQDRIDRECRARHGITLGMVEERTFDFIPAGSGRPAPPTWRRPDPATGPTIEATISTFAGPILGRDGLGQPALHVYSRDAFDDYLANRSEPVPVYVDHGVDDDGNLSAEWGEPVGELTELWTDDVGLHGRGRLYDDSPASLRAAEMIASGKLHAFSVNGKVHDSVPTGRAVGGLEVWELRQVSVREAGPVRQPADVKAVIREFDGVPVGVSLDDMLDRLLDEFGIDVGREADRLRDEERARERRAREVADEAERRGYALKTALRRTAALRDEYSHQGTRHNPAVYTAMREAQDELGRHADCLLAHLYGDKALYREVLAVVGVRAADVETALSIPLPALLTGRRERAPQYRSGSDAYDRLQMAMMRRRG